MRESVSRETLSKRRASGRISIPSLSQAIDGVGGGADLKGGADTRESVIIGPDGNGAAGAVSELSPHPASVRIEPSEREQTAIDPSNSRLAALAAPLSGPVVAATGPTAAVSHGVGASDTSSTVGSGIDASTPLAAALLADVQRKAEVEREPLGKPASTRILTVANQKGGVGKTTSAVNLAAALAKGGLEVLVVDCDPQGNASTALGIDHRSGTPSIYEVLIEDLPMAETVVQCPDFPTLSCVPATLDLSGAEIELVSIVSRETRLRRALREYLAARESAGLPQLDYVLIDCPPSLGLLTVNAFVAGVEVLIPIQCEYYALEGLSQLIKTVELIKKHLNPELRVSTILLTMYDGRTNLSREVAEQVREHFARETLETTIPRSVRVSEAPSYGQTVVSYDGNSTGSLAYRAAARELNHRELSTTTEERV